MKLGYIIASHEVARSGKRVGYLYRERPDNELDSGWRVFSGHESQAFADDAGNFAMYNASTIVQIDPSIAPLLSHDPPVAFERDPDTGAFVQLSVSEEEGAMLTEVQSQGSGPHRCTQAHRRGRGRSENE